MSRRRLPAAGLGGMFSLAARVPIFSGYYTTPAVEGKGRADCASAARGPPLGSREERGYPGISPLPFFSRTPLGRRRFLRALPWVSGAVDWRRAFSLCASGRAAAYRPYGRVRALPWFSFGLTPNKGKVAVFLKESRLKNFYARCARPLYSFSCSPALSPASGKAPKAGRFFLYRLGFCSMPSS